jgi:hypothetical protein
MSAALLPPRRADLRPTGAGEAESTLPGPVPGVIVGLRRDR